MPTMIFANLPVKDLERATAFYTGLGYELNPQFSGDVSSCIAISETIIVMLLAESYFATFTPRPVADATKATEAILALSAESREAVDEMLSKALASGGSEPRPVSDLGFMYTRTFQDPDGHLWEIMHMDMSSAG